VAVNDAFILYLLDIIESASDDADDPYHYPVIRVLVSQSPTAHINLAENELACSERTILGGFHDTPQRWPTWNNEPRY
jgi:hypothetical protein